jgi:membrane protease YdiL (CAAX protease family)
MRWSRQQAILAAGFPVVALSALNHFYQVPLYRLHPAWYWLADAMQFVVLPAAAAWFLLRPAGIGWKDLGLGRDREPWSLLFAALLLVMATWPVYAVAERTFWAYAPADNVMTQSLSRDGAAKWLVPIYLAATAAIVEEVVYRALPWMYLQAVLAPRWRRAGYTLGSSLVFALVHSEQGPGGMLGAFWFGLVAAGLYLKVRSLWPLVLGHFAFDMIEFGPW